MFDSLIVATDGSRHAQRAVEVAGELAASHGSRLAIVHVQGHGPVPESLRHLAEVEHLAEPAGHRPPEQRVENISGNLAVVQTGDDAQGYRIWQAVGRRIAAQAEQTAKAAGAKSIKVFVDEGDPAERLLARAREVGADTIVMGRRGISDLKGLLVGSVTHKVSQLSECACLTVM